MDVISRIKECIENRLYVVEGHIEEKIGNSDYLNVAKVAYTDVLAIIRVLEQGGTLDYIGPVVTDIARMVIEREEAA